MYMHFYKITCNGYKFVASVHEKHDLYRVKFGGMRACVYYSVYKEHEKEFPNLDALGSGNDCDNDGSLPQGAGTITLLFASLKFLVHIFPFIKHVQFSDTSSVRCAKGVKVHLPTLHFAKHGTTWYQDKADALPIDKKVIKAFDKARLHLESKYIESFDEFYNKHIKRHIHTFKAMKLEQVYDGLKTCWDEANTYKEFFCSVAEIDCILLQVWLEHYIQGVWNVPHHATLYWKIRRSVIDAFPNVTIKTTTKVPKYMSGGYVDKDIYTLDDFLKRRKK